MNKRLVLIIGVLLFTLSGKAQVYNYADGEGPTPPDSVKGFYIGGTIGAYFANKNTAQIYGGYGYQRDGFLNNFENSWLNFAINGPPIQNKQRTNDAMNAADGEWSFTESDMPGIMRYRPSFLFNVHFRYMLNSDFGFFMEMGGTFPVTVGEFTITRTNNTGIQNDILETFAIRGEEQRLIINIGMHKVLGREAAERKGKNPSILPYIDLGGTLTFTKYEANFINLDLGTNNVEFFNPIVDLSIQRNVDGSVYNQANVLTGVGLGGFGSVGLQLTLGRKFTIDFGYVANLQQINLGEVSEIGLQHQFVLRAIYM
ncbi:hypothetical protein O3Q51_09040 [Cryomorphaceae bacterium 1068]|nr:hypothetical protein [Cryomorphaceae bacterium 1068]